MPFSFVNAVNTNTELAKVLSRCGKQSFGVIVKLLLGVRRVNHRQNGKHHSLVTGRQVVKELFHFLALLFNVVGKLGRKVVVGILPTLPVGRIGFNAKQTAFGFRTASSVGIRHSIGVEVLHLNGRNITCDLAVLIDAAFSVGSQVNGGVLENVVF